jgi:HEXXH motif-containing protein
LAGVPGDLVERGQVHPYAEYLAERAHLDQIPGGAGRVKWDLPGTLRAGQIKSWTIWDHAADGPLSELIDERLQPSVRRVPWDDGWRALLEEARRLVASTVPGFGPDTLEYVRRVVLTDDDTTSGTTWTDALGLLAVSRGTLTSLVDAAETLLHEALHSKAATIERGLDLPYLSEDDREFIVTIPWRLDQPEHRRWTSLRTFDAFYVYAHLSIFTASLVQAAPDSVKVRRCRRVCFRSEYLFRRLQDVCAGELDHQRRAIVDWLGALRVPAFDLSPDGRAVLESMPRP